MKTNETKTSTPHQSIATKPFFGGRSDQAFFSTERVAAKPFFQPPSVTDATIQAKGTEEADLDPSAVQRMPAFASEILTEGAVQRSPWLSPHPSLESPIQAKLAIGAPGDRYEQEADRVAQQVVQQLQTPQPIAPKLERRLPQQQTVQRETLPEDDELQMKSILQRETDPEEEDELQMKPMSLPRSPDGAMNTSTDLESAIAQARGSGSPLVDTIREPMEQSFGVDFSNVTVHTDSQSDQLNRSIQAKAFTTGQDIFFRQGAYQPNSQGGKELLAHELTHVVQQNEGVVSKKPLLQHPATEAQWTSDLIQAKGNLGGQSQSPMEAQRPNRTGIPDNLKTDIESLSGVSLDHVKVHYNSAQPVQLRPDPANLSYRLRGEVEPTDVDRPEKVETELAEKVPFADGGETHHLWFEVVNGEAIPMVASTPGRIEDFVRSLTAAERLQVEQAANYNNELVTIVTHVVHLRDMATTALAVARANPQVAANLLLTLTPLQRQVIQALRFVWHALGPGAVRTRLGLGLWRGRLDDVQRRLERCLDAAGHSQQNEAYIDWIYRLEDDMVGARALLLNPTTTQHMTDAAAAVEALETQTANVEEGIGVAAMAARDTVTTALTNSESPTWRQRRDQVLAILADARATITAQIPFGRVRFRGSLATGWKGPHKVDANKKAKRFDPTSFDADAFLELPNEDWKALVEAGTVDANDLYAKVSDLNGWPHQQMMLNLKQTISTRLAQVQGYQTEENGDVHFDFTVQPTTSSWVNIRDGLKYPLSAFSAVPALENALPTRPNSSVNERKRFPGIFGGE